ncbi:hypothetical protein H6G93_01535 [Nostoc sp. FACHB-973]|nr:hypothetical protein [Nostoc sp. FACHB-973]
MKVELLKVKVAPLSLEVAPLSLKVAPLNSKRVSHVYEGIGLRSIF